MTIMVFVGDVTPHLCDCAKSYDSNAEMITSQNYDDLKSGVYFCSLGDLNGLSEFACVLRQANVINYCPPPDGKWTDEKLRRWTEDYIRVHSCDCEKKVLNYDCKKPDIIKKMRTLVDGRKSESPQIWVSGCSISHGLGVLPHQRYAHIVGEEMSMPVSFLTASGSSIRWAANQILKSDIRSGDIVLWGLTFPERITYWNEDESEIQFGSYTSHYYKNKKYLRSLIKKKYYVSEQVVYEALESIDSVENFVNKINAKLIICAVGSLQHLCYYLYPKDNFLVLTDIYGRDLSNRYLDLGDCDNLHPGPKTHEMYAKKIVEKLSLKNP